MVHDITTLVQLDKAADEFLEEFTNPQVFLFQGEMGVGKTTFIRKVCRKLGVEDEVTSPTFSLVNEYETAEGATVFHFDFYRLDDEEEAMDIGVEEYFYSGNHCLVEWPEKIPSLLPQDAVEVKLWFEGDNRQISWNK